MSPVQARLSCDCQQGVVVLPLPCRPRRASRARTHTCCGAGAVQSHGSTQTASAPAGPALPLTWVGADGVDVRCADDPDSSPTVVLHAHADADGNPGDHSHYKDDAKNDPSYRCASARGMEICSQS